jgi:hypothetical protein
VQWMTPGKLRKYASQSSSSPDIDNDRPGFGFGAGLLSGHRGCNSLPLQSITRTFLKRRQPWKEAVRFAIGKESTEHSARKVLRPAGGAGQRLGQSKLLSAWGASRTVRVIAFRELLPCHSRMEWKGYRDEGRGWVSALSNNTSTVKLSHIFLFYFISASPFLSSIPSHSIHVCLARNDRRKEDPPRLV